MASIVASAFQDRILSALSPDQAALLDNARGGGPEHREMNRALLLADRAVREWAAGAISAQRPGDKNRFEGLDQLAKPEAYSFDVQPAASAELAVAQTDEQRAVVRAVRELADAVPELDTEATLSMNTPALRATPRLPQTSSPPPPPRPSMAMRRSSSSRPTRPSATSLVSAAGRTDSARATNSRTTGPSLGPP